MRLNRSGNRRGRPGRLRTRAARQKPCVVCDEPIVRRYPAQLKAVAAHKRCQGTLLTLRRAQARKVRLLALWRRYSPDVRVLVALAYREGARSTAERLRIRARGRALARLTGGRNG